VPLGVIYLLGDVSADDTTTVTPVPPSDALIALVGNTYANGLLDQRLRAREFEVLGEIVQQMPIRRVTRPADLAYLRSFCESVLADLEGCGYPRFPAFA
jgi:hypothetical protein